MRKPEQERETEQESLRENTRRWLGRTVRKVVDATRATIGFRLKPITDRHDRRGFMREESFEHRYPFGLTIGPLHQGEADPWNLSESAERRLQRLELIRQEALQEAINQMTRSYGLCPDALRIGEDGLLWVSDDALKAIQKQRENRAQIRSARKVRIRKSVRMEMMTELEMPLLYRASRQDRKASAALKILEDEVLRRFLSSFDPKFQNLSRASGTEMGLSAISLDQFGGRCLPLQVIHQRTVHDEDLEHGKQWQSDRVVAYAVDKMTGRIGLLKLMQLDPTEVGRPHVETQTSIPPMPATPQGEVEIPSLSTDAWSQMLPELPVMSERKFHVGPDQTTKVAPGPHKALRATPTDHFDREARALRSLAGEGAPVLFHASRMKEWGYLFMECIPKATPLDQLFQMRGRFPVFTNTRSIGVLDLIGNTAEILDRLHREGVIHQDIKPANLVYQEEEGLLYLVDFGGGMTRSFAPPEAFEDYQAQDERSDIFALGATAYYLLTGMDPFGGRGANESSILRLREEQDVIPLSNLRLSIPAEACSLIEWMLQKKPSDRPQSALVVLQRVEEILTKKGISHQDIPHHWNQRDSDAFQVGIA